MNQFLKEFKKLNPSVPESKAREIYNEKKKKEKNDNYEIIKVPNLKQKEPEAVPEPEVIQKSEEEVLEERRLREEEEQKKQEEEDRKLFRKNIKIVLDTWGKNLSRIIQENGKNVAYPQFPLHPMTNKMATPTDIFTIIKHVSRLNHNDDDDTIIMPFLLIILASDKTELIKLYTEFNKDSKFASVQLRNYFLNKKIKFNEMWVPIILPPLRADYVQMTRGELQNMYPVTIDLEQITQEEAKKLPLQDVMNLHDLLEKLSKNPNILHSVSDGELQIYDLTPAQIMEIRTIFAEKSKTKQKKAVKEFIKKIKGETESESSSNTKTKQTGGGMNSNDNTPTTTSIFALLI